MQAHNGPLHTSKDQTYQTPEEILDLVREVGAIDLDPCTISKNPTGAKIFFTVLDDGLSQPWNLPGVSLVYVNPPYNKNIKWVMKINAEQDGKMHVILLVPSRTDTKWYNAASDTAQGFCNIRGRLKFKGMKNAAPFPSVVFYWGPDFEKFKQVFSSIGRVHRLEK